MTVSAKQHPLLQGVNQRDYTIKSLDDEMRVDKLCVDLLRHFYQHQTKSAGVNPEQAGDFCHGADYFLREFIIAECQDNIFQISAVRVRQFAGHWYIIRTPEPNLAELEKILLGTAAFYSFLASQGLVKETLAEKVTQQSQELAYYQRRIDDFWAIEGDGYGAWRRACPLDD